VTRPQHPGKHGPRIVKAIDKEVRDLARPLRDELKPPEVPEPCEAMALLRRWEHLRRGGDFGAAERVLARLQELAASPRGKAKKEAKPS
jgi:hypothetical protein